MGEGSWLGAYGLSDLDVAGAGGHGLRGLDLLFDDGRHFERLAG